MEVAFIGLCKLALKTLNHCPLVTNEGEWKAQ